MSAAVAPARSPAREVSRIMLAPKTIENRHRILPSIRMRNSAQLARFKPVAPPATVGSLPAAIYIPKTRTFAGRIPSSANPRSVSNELMRSSGVIGPMGIIRSPATVFEGRFDEEYQAHREYANRLAMGSSRPVGRTRCPGGDGGGEIRRARVRQPAREHSIRNRRRIQQPLR